MQNPELIYSEHDLIVKKDSWGRVLIGLLVLAMLAFSLFFGVSTKNFFKENHLATAITIVIILTAILFLIRDGLDTRVRFVICKDGIWTVKTGLTKWSAVQYYYFEERKSGKFPGKFLKVKLVDVDKPISIDTSLFKQSEESIEKSIRYNTGDNNVIQLLRETVYQ